MPAGTESKAEHRIGDAEVLLHSAGLRSTPQRRRLLEALAETDRPLSVDGMWENTGREGGDRATVYRSVRDLLDAGIVHHAYTIGRTAYYELADHCGPASCHPHFICRICGAVRCLYDVDVPTLPDIGNEYVVERSKVTLMGVCPACARNGGNKKGTKGIVE